MNSAHNLWWSASFLTMEHDKKKEKQKKGKEAPSINPCPFCCCRRPIVCRALPPSFAVLMRPFLLLFLLDRRVRLSLLDRRHHRRGCCCCYCCCFCFCSDCRCCYSRRVLILGSRPCYRHVCRHRRGCRRNHLGFRPTLALEYRSVRWRSGFPWVFRRAGLRCTV